MNDVAGLAGHPALRTAEVDTSASGGARGVLRTIASAARFNGRARCTAAVPRLGEHTRAIEREFKPRESKEQPSAHALQAPCVFRDEQGAELRIASVLPRGELSGDYRRVGDCERVAICGWLNGSVLTFCASQGRLRVRLARERHSL